MKMGFGIFFGILLIFVGISIIIRILFDIDIPVFKLFVALIFLYIGIRLLAGDFSIQHAKSGENAIFFGETQFKGIPKDNEYTILFGQATIDLSEEKITGEIQKLKINTVFGGTELIINETQPVRIKADAAFAGARLPGGNETSFGSAHYESGEPDKEKGFYDIESSVVFGDFKVKIKR